MMAIAATMTKAASVITAIGVIGAGSYTLDKRHAPMEVVSDIGVMQIFDLVEIAQRDGSQQWICRAIEQEIIKLCSKQPEHFLCRDPESVHSLKAKAGCD